MKAFNTKSKDSVKLLETIKAEFILKSSTEKESQDGMWFELLEWDGVGKYHITFYDKCASCHEAFSQSANDTCVSRLTMGHIRVNYEGNHTIQMSKQITFDELNMDAIYV